MFEHVVLESKLSIPFVGFLRMQPSPLPTTGVEDVHPTLNSLCGISSNATLRVRTKPRRPRRDTLNSLCGISSNATRGVARAGRMGRATLATLNSLCGISSNATLSATNLPTSWLVFESLNSLCGISSNATL